MSESIQATPDMAVYCFDILHAHANKQKEPPMPTSIPRHIKWFRNIPINFPPYRDSLARCLWLGRKAITITCAAALARSRIWVCLRVCASMQWRVLSTTPDSSRSARRKSRTCTVEYEFVVWIQTCCAAGLSASGLRTGQGLPRLGRGRSRNTHQLLGWDCQQKCCLFAWGGSRTRHEIIALQHNFFPRKI